MKKHIALCGIIASMPFTTMAAPKLKGEFSVKSPAFLSLLPGLNPGEKDLYISSFGIGGGDSVLQVPLHEGSLGELSSWKVAKLSSKLIWPNEVTEVPESVFGPHKISVGTGFLVPGRSTGSVEIIDRTDGSVLTISHKKDGYFYHRVLWHDMNGDGRLDAVTARGKKGMLGGSDGELLWLEQPADPKAPGAWVEHVIAKGPDVNFILADLDGNGSTEIIATQFFGKKLSLHWQDNGSWVSKTLDDTLGAAFDLELVDLNGDGHLDLLVSNHEGSADKAAIYGYEIPAAPREDAWTRHTLLSGIKTEKGGFNQASPGSAFAVQPNLKKSLSKPWILAGGDGSTKVHLLLPQAKDWEYKEVIIQDTGSTIGTIAVGDVDNDGIQELFVPAYDINKVFVYSLDGSVD